ncbi:oligomeric Golgi complex component 3 [Stachybotrys elegans]|uniref:Conserved oligomeric Golgi complex subunit 3 n=1 Tax=Stachybotrys elegans TaxID=80388 RepID=A0A8K0WW18_9HYPO|nr:oligomeric Golgi complex component 3 [Stachybotrys elegans]
MYEDAWYSIVPEATRGPSGASGHGHRRKESLLQQPNEPEPLENVFEEIEDTNTPPEPAIIRRAASYSDFYHVAKAQLAKDTDKKYRKKTARRDRTWEALMLPVDEPTRDPVRDDPIAVFDSYGETLLETSQQEYLLYSDQLTLTERHLDGLIEDANTTLKLLTTLSNSFQSVEVQTSSFQAHCEDLLAEQKRLEKLADDVGTDLHYYEYLDTVTRRLNAPGASHLVDADPFGEMVDNIDACIGFMNSHETYRDRDSYLARYNALLVKAMHLLDHGFTNRLEKISSEISRQIAATNSESARHALAYGRFEEMLMDTHSLLPNIQAVIRRVWDQFGRPVDATHSTPTYAESATNMFHTYLTTRDRDLKPLTQSDLAEYQKESKSLSPETASRNFIKHSFERLFNEEDIFVKVFNMEATWSNSPDSAYVKIKNISTTMPQPANLAPLATALQSVLQAASLQAICTVVGWLANEYSIADSEDDESPFYRKCREYTAVLLAHHLWPFTDNAFEAEVAKSISKAPVQDASLQIGPVVGGVSSSNAFPLVKRATELLVMFDHSMPKERSSRNSPVVFKIVRETIQVLQKAEARIKSLKTNTDPDLFMIKNLLIIKNELLSLEIGDIKSHAQSMQHFGQIWDTLSPQNWVGFFTSMIGGVGGIGAIGGSLWSRGAPSVTAKTLTVEDMNEQLDELLRQSIYGFTKRWATLMNDSQARKVGVKPIAKMEAELETMLQTAFSNQPEVIMKLKEAIQLNAQAQTQAKDGEKGVRQY